MHTSGQRATQLLSPIGSDQLMEFLDNDETNHARTLYIGNLDARVTRRLLFELLIQVGPVESIRIVPPREGTAKTMAFVVFEDSSSVRYSMLVLQDIALFRLRLSLNYSGLHKNKPRVAIPPCTPTFFQEPLGFASLPYHLQLRHYQILTIPPPTYKSGYFLPANQSTLGIFHQYNPPSSHCDPRTEQSAEQVLPPTKKFRGYPPPPLSSCSNSMDTLSAVTSHNYTYSTDMRRSDGTYSPMAAVSAPPPPPSLPINHQTRYPYCTDYRFVASHLHPTTSMQHHIRGNFGNTFPVPMDNTFYSYQPRLPINPPYYSPPGYGN